VVGHLALSKREYLVTAETASSIATRQDEGGHWYPEMEEERFVAVFTCGRCGDPVTVAGRAATDRVPPDGDYGTILHPEFVRPAPL